MTKSFYWIWATIGLLLCGCGGENAGNRMTLNGAGATFPSPVYANWTYNYSQASGNRVRVNYQGVGSGAGVQQLREGTVDFAGTDEPLSEEELKRDGLVQLPMLAGGVVVIVNLPDMSDGVLKLSSETLADIFLGKIKKWNAPQIQKDNPGRTLPNLEITPVYRADSSGTSYLFTRFLSGVSQAWKNEVGTGKSVHFPTGVGGQKNPGVVRCVAKITGSIGYTEYTYAAEAKMACVQLTNPAGHFLAPTVEAFSISLENPQDAKAWPITGITYLVYRQSLEASRTNELQNYIRWCFRDGKGKAVEMKYVPIPDETLQQMGW